MKTCLIIGAGPSECTVNYPAIPASWATFGMNLMYRFYSETGYPTYFGCFDYHVNQDQAEAFRGMVEDPACPIERFFMVEKVCKSPKLTVLPQKDKSKGFSTNLATFGYGWCTGANCAQVAACLGFKRILLVGIDGYPVEMVDGAVKDGKHLKMEFTPESNANYSRKYQLEGDEFNLPRGDTFHKPAWEKFRAFTKKNGIEVINCSWGDVADCFPRSTLIDEIKKIKARPRPVTFCMALKARSERAFDSIQSIVTPENARSIHFMVCEDKSDDMLDLSSFEYRHLVTHYVVDTGETWNRSKLLNYGIKRAKTKFVAGWDADFLFSPEFVPKYLKALASISPAAEYLSIMCTETADSVRTQLWGDKKQYVKEWGYKKGQLWGHFLTHLKKQLSFVHGFDESFTMWGHEEVDLDNRLERKFAVTETQVKEPGLLLHVSHDDDIRNKDKTLGTINRKKREQHDADNVVTVNPDGWGEL